MKKLLLLFAIFIFGLNTAEAQGTRKFKANLSLEGNKILNWNVDTLFGIPNFSSTSPAMFYNTADSLSYTKDYNRGSYSSIGDSVFLGSTLWQTTSGKYVPTENKPYNFSFNSVTEVMDSVNLLGAATIPFWGKYSGYNSGLFLNGFGNWSDLGGEALRHNLGFFNSTFGFTGLQVDPLIQTVTINAENNMLVNANSTLNLQGVNRVNLNADTSTLRGTRILSLSSDTSLALNSSKSITLNSDTLIDLRSFQISGKAKEMIFTTNNSSDNRNWGMALWGDSTKDGSVKRSLDLFVFDTTLGLDEKYIYLQDEAVRVGVKYETVSNSEFKSNELLVDSLGLSFRYEIPTGTTGREDTTKINANGVVLPNISTEPTGENGSMYYSTSLNKLRVYEDGVYQNIVSNPHGWIQYTSDNYTEASPIVIAAGSTETLWLNCSTINDAYKPSGIDSLYNRADSTIISNQLGAYGDLRIDFKAKTTAATAANFDVILDIGLATMVYEDTEIFSEGINTEQRFSVNTPYYTLATFLANGAKIKIKSSTGNTSIYDVRLLISKH
jgi:hypothetical protein